MQKKLFAVLSAACLLTTACSTQNQQNSKPAETKAASETTAETTTTAETETTKEETTTEKETAPSGTTTGTDKSGTKTETDVTAKEKRTEDPYPDDLMGEELTDKDRQKRAEALIKEFVEAFNSHKAEDLQKLLLPESILTTKDPEAELEAAELVEEMVGEDYETIQFVRIEEMHYADGRDLNDIMDIAYLQIAADCWNDIGVSFFSSDNTDEDDTKAQKWILQKFGFSSPEEADQAYLDAEDSDKFNTLLSFDAAGITDVFCADVIFERKDRVDDEDEDDSEEEKKPVEESLEMLFYEMNGKLYIYPD